METLRVSSYMIPVKLENEEGKYTLIHGYTGAIDIVTESLLNQIKHIETENTLSEEILHTLQKRGYITNKTAEEESMYVQRIAKALHQRESILMKNFTWVVTYNCNFRCPYCFEYRDIKDGEKNIVFSKPMVDKAYQAMETIEPTTQFRSSIITLYGGEPLLAENKEVVAYIVEEGIKRGYKFTAITNGYDLNHYIDLLSAEKIYKVQITLDGAKEQHDQKRIHYQDHNTFNKIITNIQLALEKDVKIVVRINIDNKNIENFTQLKEVFEEKGFTQKENFRFYTSILRNNENISEKDKQKLEFISVASFFKKQQHNEFSSYCQDYGTYQKIYNAIQKGKPLPLRSSFCSSQTGGYVLDPIGNIYPCWETVGNKLFQIGNYLNSQITWNKNIVKQWQGKYGGNNIRCKQCKYVLFCGGGCFFHQENQTQCYFFHNTFKEIVNRAFTRFHNKQHY